MAPQSQVANNPRTAPKNIKQVVRQHTIYWDSGMHECMATLHKCRSWEAHNLLLTATPAQCVAIVD